MLESILIILAGLGAANAIVNEYIFEPVRTHLPKWELVQRLFDCLTCMSFWTTLVLALCFGYTWKCVLLALTASFLGHLITYWENK